MEDRAQQLDKALRERPGDDGLWLEFIRIQPELLAFRQTREQLQLSSKRHQETSPTAAAASARLTRHLYEDEDAEDLQLDARGSGSGGGSGSGVIQSMQLALYEAALKRCPDSVRLHAGRLLLGAQVWDAPRTLMSWHTSLLDLVGLLGDRASDLSDLHGWIRRGRQVGVV